MGLRYASVAGGPICYESSDVRVVDGQRDIQHFGTLVAVLVKADSDHDCQRIGMIFDEKTTLVVDCLHSDSEIDAFQDMCRKQEIPVTELARIIRGPCPPPPNQMQVAGWAAQLFRELRPTR